jgi:hypothetical protein
MSIDKISMHAPTAIDNAIDEQAVCLNRLLAHRTYTDGDERHLADAVLEEIATPAMMDDALVYLVWNKVHSLVAVDSLLDETEAASYVTVDTLTDVLVAAIRAERDLRATLHRLVTAEIDDIADLYRRHPSYRRGHPTP